MFISFVTYTTRSNMAMALVTMVRPPERENTSHPDLCPSLLQDTPEESDIDGTDTGEAFDWSPQLQGSVLSCFFWTYTLLQLPSGYVAGRFGGRLPITISFAITAVVTALGPTFAHSSPYLFIASRAFMGIFQAAIYPGMFVIILTWMPIQERSMAWALCDSGIHIGNIVMYFSSGFLIQRFTWTSMFYSPAVGAVIAFIATAILLRNKPEDHFLITDEEIAFIKQSSDLESKKDCEMQASGESESDSNSMDRVSLDHSIISSDKGHQYAIPWKKIMTNKVVIVLLFFKFCRALAFATVTANMPGYFKNVLNESIVSVGITYAIFTGLTFVATLASAKLSELVIARGWLTRTNTRKVFSIFSGLIPAIAFMLIPVMRCNIVGVKFFFYLYAVGQGLSIATEALTPAEISVNFSAILYPIGNIATIIPAFIAPLIIGAVLGKFGLEWVAWDMIFHSFGALGIVSSILFFFFASAEIQDFDDVTDLQPRDYRSMSVVSAMSFSRALPR